MPSDLVHVRLDAPAPLLPELAAFFGDRLGLELERTANGLAVAAGGSVLEFRAAAGEPFYHLALLVPGDRFDEALVWARERVELLPVGAPPDVGVDFPFWDAQATYFHDPAGTIMELIAHRDTGAFGATGPFAAEELLGISEIGVVCDPPSLAAALERTLGLELWDGSVDGERGLAFVGEKARTLILCRPGRPWLPTGRPAEEHPVGIVLSGKKDAEVPLPSGGFVRQRRERDG